MRSYHIFCLAMLAGLPATANATCQPSFVDSSNAVTLTPSSSLDEQQVVERFYVRVRNAGDSACVINLGVSRDIGASDSGFPLYTLSGPGGVIPVVPAAGVSSAGAGFTKVDVAAGGQVSVPYDIRLSVGWGSEAGDYSQQLIYTLLSDDGSDEITQRTQLSLNIPSAARVRFAGAQGAGGASLLDLGLLSPDGPTFSPPFAIRVLSTAGYQMQIVSQNAGALVRAGSTERIPYRLSIGGRRIDLAGGGDLISAGHHTSSTGDVHPISIMVDPDPSRHAGDYSDRVIVTVTPI